MRVSGSVIACACAVLVQSAAAATPPQRRTGEFNISSTVAALLGEASARAFEQVIAADQPIEWSTYVPESYDAEVAAGILVFIGAGNSGRIPKEWKELMDRRNLIWIGANRSGNKTATALRVSARG